MDGTCMNMEACRYCISSGTDDVCYTLLIYSYCAGVGDTQGSAVIDIFHNTFLLYHDPWTKIVLLHFIVTYCDLNKTVHPAPQRFPIDTKKLCVRMGNICPSYD